MAFSSIKELLKGIYLDVKKGIRYIIWLDFRIFKKETLLLRKLSAFITGFISLIKSTPVKL
jgi:hypothetical protein